MPCITKKCYQVFPSDTVGLISNGSLARINTLECSQYQTAEGHQHGTSNTCLDEVNKLLKVMVQGQGNDSSNGVSFTLSSIGDIFSL